MGAPIQRYNDPRLYGHEFAKLFCECYQFTRRTVAYPLPPNSPLITECAIRALKFFAGMLGMILAAAPAFMGRLIQVLHYHSLSQVTRGKPPLVENLFRVKVSSKGNSSCSISFSRAKLVTEKCYFQTSLKKAQSILRQGFNLETSKCKEDAPMGYSVCVSWTQPEDNALADNALLFTLTLNLAPYEIANIEKSQLKTFYQSLKESLKGKAENYYRSALRKRHNVEKLVESAQQVFAEKAIGDFFCSNGYRALYVKDTGKLAIYDPSCISIESVQ